MSTLNVLSSSRLSSSLKRTGRILGSGANGTVHLGFDEETGRFLAIKELSSFVVDSNDAGSDSTILAAEVANEVSVMRHAHHENLVQYLGTRVNPETQHVEIIMEYVSGGAVRSLLKQKQGLRESVLRMYGRDILRGMQYLHETCRTCHRDLKPDNILITPEGRCKLADFGCSRTLQSSTTLLRTHVGTPYYMAPEVINGEGYNQSADVWSFGATLYEMAVGEPPYANASNAMAVMFRVATEGKLPPVPSHVSAAVADVVQRCCVAAPSQRPTASELLRLPFFTEDLHSDVGPGVPSIPTLCDGVDTASQRNSTTGVSHTTNRAAAGGNSQTSPEGFVVGSTDALRTSLSVTNGRSLVSSLPPASPAAPGSPVQAASPSGQNPVAVEDDDFPFGAARGDAAASEEPWRLCQYCQTALALFDCDQCADSGLRQHRFCPQCWRIAHAHQRAVHHRKRPLLVPVSAVSPTSTAGVAHKPRAIPAEHVSTDSGVLLSDGTFVDLTAGEQSEWECGRCGTLNDGPLRNCQTCDHLR